MQYSGTTAAQDNRFSNKEKKLLKVLKFGDCLTKKVDMSTVRLDTIKPWISTKITEVLGSEDDLVEDFIFNQLHDERFPDPKKIQMSLTGFLNGKNARLFMTDLWALLLSAQESPTGIPDVLIDMNKEEIDERTEGQKRVQEIYKRLERRNDKEEIRRDRSRERNRSRSRDKKDTGTDRDRRNKERPRSKRSNSRSPSRNSSNHVKSPDGNKKSRSSGSSRSSRSSSKSKSRHSWSH